MEINHDLNLLFIIVTLLLLQSKFQFVFLTFVSFTKSARLVTYNINMQFQFIVLYLFLPSNILLITN